MGTGASGPDTRGQFREEDNSRDHGQEGGVVRAGPAGPEGILCVGSRIWLWLLAVRLSGAALPKRGSHGAGLHRDAHQAHVWQGRESSAVANVTLHLAFSKPSPVFSQGHLYIFAFILVCQPFLDLNCS